jgi:hypothetical protein
VQKIGPGYKDSSGNPSEPTTPSEQPSPLEGAPFNFGSGNSGSSQPQQSTGGSYNSEQLQGNSGSYSGICQTLQPVLVQSCDTLVNSDGSLTSDGSHAMHCIRNGILLGGGAATLGVPLSIVLKGLSILASPTGCDGVVNMSVINKLGNIG